MPRRSGQFTYGILPKQRGFQRTAGFYGRFAPSAGELKFFDLDLDDTVVAAAGGITDSINKIAQGVTEVTRVGRKCTIKSIAWRYQTSLGSFDAQATPQLGQELRIMMYLDKQANGATAAVTDILESADFQSFNNLANSGRFRILMDKIVNITYPSLASDGAGVVSSNGIVRGGRFFKRCNIPIEFSATTGAITEIRSNNIGVLLISNTGVVGFNSKIRLRFSD